MRLFVSTMLLSTLSILSFATKVVGSGKRVDKEYKLSNVNQVAVNGFFEVHVTKGTTNKLKINSDSNLLPYIKVEEKSGTLKIYLNLDYDEVKPHKVNLQLKSLASYHSQGKAKVSLHNFDEKKLEVKLTGNCELHMNDSNVESLSLDLIGNNRLTLGKVNSVSGDISKGYNTLVAQKGTDLSKLKKGFS